MKYFHSAQITAFVKDPIEEEVLFDTFLAKANIDSEKSPLVSEKIEPLEGYSEHLTIFSINIKNKIEKFMQFILANTSDTWIDTIDEENTIYIRLSKEDFVDGKFTPTKTGNCVHIKAKIAAYPSNKENAIATYQRFIDEMR
jgi:RNA binding exosome subunit